MKQDSWLSRVVRPFHLIWFSLLFTAILLTDGNIEGFTVKEVYITVLETILVVMYGSYFLGKSGEHITRINNPKEDEDA